MPPSHIGSRQLAATALLLLFLLHMTSGIASSQTVDLDRTPSQLAWSSDSTQPRRFVSVHGRRAAIFGYSQDGLEAWIYPWQILNSYGVRFRPEGASTEIEGQRILRRIVYSPEAVTRIYAGPDFIVREKFFVPIDGAGIIVRYEVNSARPVDVVIQFTPVLDLMWPASVGGQEAQWNAKSSAYVLSEATHRFAASVGSPDTVAHDDTPNIGQRIARDPGLGFTIRAGGGHNSAQLVIAGDAVRQTLNDRAQQLIADGAALEGTARDHYTDLLGHALQIETPDAGINRALAWSEVALDQAWVCNSDLGCGSVAGYGPSRKARRPQYDWFFAGDGMVAVRGLLASGQYSRAREELEFILKYQDPKTGMIWHELTQSASFLDWARFPYMFAHVDLSFDFLSTVADYFSTSGDRDFVNAHWPAIQSAYNYCRALVNPESGLPRIPSDKGGAREQDALSDELALSVSWAAASQAYAGLAAATGHNAEAQAAKTASRQAAEAIPKRYWDAQQNAWITGFTRAGSALTGHDLSAASLLEGSLLPQAQRNALLEQFATSDFETDWGTRSRAASTGNYDPASYASGSVWSVSTAGTATTFWGEHRPATALPIWTALVPWSSLDSLGHMHEALAGDFYREEMESVPEQTWSSAAFFTSAVRGLLGLQVDGAANRLRFAPHLPANWNSVRVRNVHVGQAEISFQVTQSMDGIKLEAQNNGAPVPFVFDPEIPLGAQLHAARLGNRSLAIHLEQHGQDTHADVEFDLPHGDTLLAISYSDGVAIISDLPAPEIGEPSSAPKITGVKLQGNTCTVDFDYRASAASGFDFRTSWRLKGAQGGTVVSVSPDLYRFTVSVPENEKESPVYRHGKAVMEFAETKHH